MYYVYLWLQHYQEKLFILKNVKFLVRSVDCVAIFSVGLNIIQQKKKSSLCIILFLTNCRGFMANCNESSFCIVAFAKVIQKVSKQVSSNYSIVHIRHTVLFLLIVLLSKNLAPLAKGRLISICLFGVFNCPKK